MYANIIEEFPFECSILSDPLIMLGRGSLKLYSLDPFVKFIRSITKVVLLRSRVIFWGGIITVSAVRFEAHMIINNPTANNRIAKYFVFGVINFS